MKVLFLSSMALFDKTRFGGAKRLYYFARELSRHAEVSLICVDGCREWPAGEPQPAEFADALFLNLGGRKNPWRRAASLPVDIDEDIRRHQGSIDAFLRGRRFDATLFAFPLSLSFLGKGWDASLGKVVYLEDDLLPESYRKGASGQAGQGGSAKPGLLARAKQAWRHRQSLVYYRRKLAGASAFICISAEERDVVKGMLPGIPVSILSYGLPLDEYPRLTAAQNPMTLGFIGNYRHLPNLAAATWLVGEVFPYLQARFPDLRLTLAGPGLPQEMIAVCAGRPGITYLGEVAELPDFYGSIGIFVNAINDGRGMRTKVVEAAAFGIPVLSTPLGAEGLEALNLPLWNTPEELAAALTGLQDPARYRTLADTNRKAVEDRFSMEKLGAELAEILRP